MDKALNGLFILTLSASLVGLLAKGVSLTMSLILFGPVAVAIFTAAAFLYLLVAVIFEPSPKPADTAMAEREDWWAEPALQHSNS